MSVLPEIGFEAVRIEKRFDPFRGTTKEKTARRYGVAGVTVSGRRP